MKAFRKFCILLALAVPYVSTAGRAIQARKSADQPYHEALVKKEGDGGLQAAIKLFQKLITDFPNERAVASKARCRSGAWTAMR